MTPRSRKKSQYIQQLLVILKDLLNITRIGPNLDEQSHGWLGSRPIEDNSIWNIPSHVPKENCLSKRWEKLQKWFLCCSFTEELANMRKGRSIKIYSRIATLNPTLDDGIIRKDVFISMNWMHLPSYCRANTMLQTYHEIQGHMGKQQAFLKRTKSFG